MMRSIALAPAGRRGRTRPARRVHGLVQALIPGLLAWAAPAGSATWLEQAQSDLICAGLADEAERQSLAAPVLPAPIDAKSVTAYFRGPPRDQRHS